MLPLWSFQGAREPAPALHEKEPARGPVSQNSAAYAMSRSTLFPGESDHPTTEVIKGPGAYRSKSSCIP
jgi:hypothetical protein